MGYSEDSSSACPGCRMWRWSCGYISRLSSAQVWHHRRDSIGARKVTPEMPLAICTMTWFHCSYCTFSIIVISSRATYKLHCVCRLSCGTTWHSAGLLGASRATQAHTKITTYSNELYTKLEEETGLGTGTFYIHVSGCVYVCGREIVRVKER